MDCLKENLMDCSKQNEADTCIRIDAHVLGVILWFEFATIRREAFVMKSISCASTFVSYCCVEDHPVPVPVTIYLMRVSSPLSTKVEKSKECGSIAKAWGIA